MRLFAIFALLGLLIPSPVLADGDLTTPISLPVVAKYRVASLEIDYTVPELRVVYQKGYLEGAAFVSYSQHELRITDTRCALDMRVLIPLSDFPPAYRVNPATTFLTSAMTQANVKANLETWIKNTPSLGL